MFAVGLKRTGNAEFKLDDGSEAYSISGVWVG